MRLMQELAYMNDWGTSGPTSTGAGGGSWDAQHEDKAQGGRNLTAVMMMEARRRM
jgi:hypothetical protein